MIEFQPERLLREGPRSVPVVTEYIVNATFLNIFRSFRKIAWGMSSGPGRLRRIGRAPITARRDRKEITMSTTAILAPASAPASPPRRRRLRSVGAVLGGLLATFVVTTAVDIALHALGAYPPVGVRMADSLFLLALGYRIVFNIGGSYVTARLAPARPLHHALTLGLVGIVIATAGAIAFWSSGPAWYSLANIAIALPCAWAGGRLVKS
jgi:hypothetical protein